MRRMTCGTCGLHGKDGKCEVTGLRESKFAPACGVHKSKEDNRS